MSVRYKKEWESNGNIARLIRALNEGTEPNESGIEFTASDHSELFDLLADGFNLTADIGHAEIAAIARRSFLDLRMSGAVGQVALIKAVQAKVRQRDAQPSRDFSLWTKLRLQHLHQGMGSRFRIDEVSIELASSLPQYLQLQEHFVSGVGRIDPNKLPFFGYVIVRSRGKNTTDATRRMFDALELFFAVVNTTWRSVNFSEQRRPSAKFWEGPHQFIFDGRKFLGTETVWYNPDFREDTWNSFPPKARDFLARKDQVRLILKLIQNHPMREMIANALRSISSGMQSQNLSYRLMRFWSAAEILYAPEGERTNSKKLIERITFASNDDYRWLDRLKLEAAYEMRNSYVHRGVNDNDTSILVQNLREDLLRHIYYLIQSGSGLANQKDWIKVVDLPRSEYDLAAISKAIERRRNIAAHGYHTADEG